MRTRALTTVAVPRRQLDRRSNPVSLQGLLALALTMAATLGCAGDSSAPSTPFEDPPRPDEAWNALGPTAFGGSGEVASLGEEYLEKYLAFFPTRATSAGAYQYDDRLPDRSAEAIENWFAVQDDVLARLDGALDADCAEPGDLCEAARVDAELLRREIELALIDWRERRVPWTTPSLWTATVGSSTVHLLVREDRPAAERAAFVVERLLQVPRLLEQGRGLLQTAEPDELVPLRCRMAAGQGRSLASFHEQGILDAFGDGLDRDLVDRLSAAATGSAAALREFADFADQLAERATGTPVLGEEMYARRFALYTGLETPVDEILVAAERALRDQLLEADRHAEAIWSDTFDEEPPAEAKERVRALFRRVGDDHAATLEEFIEDYRTLVLEAERFVKEHDIVTTADPLTLITDRSPSYFAGAAVGGVYSAGPYAPDAQTLLYLPTPPDSFDEEQRRSFFRDFNHHFNVMITPHELMPGHYLQLKWAARHPSKIRAMFGDAVTIEGWGTFAERVMLEAGWGDDLAYAAHLKKRMENTARTIVDIRVHTQGMGEDEVERFVIDEALQEEQFARNMRRRTLTTSPQLVTYHLGSREIERVYGEFQERYPEAPVRAFTDGMMAAGPVPLDRLVGLLEPRGGGPAS